MVAKFPQVVILGLALCIVRLSLADVVYFGVYTDASCTTPMVDGHEVANMTLSKRDCKCMSYSDDQGNIQVNCNYDPICEADSIFWTQRVGVEDTTDIGCSDEGGGKLIDAELHLDCTEVETHMGTTYQKLLPPTTYAPEDVCS